LSCSSTRVPNRDTEPIRNALREHHLTCRGLGLQARRGVHDISNGREVKQCPLADVPDERLADIDPDAQLNEGR
jgi:hypothetical protein